MEHLATRPPVQPPNERNIQKESQGFDIETEPYIKPLVPQLEIIYSAAELVNKAALRCCKCHSRQATEIKLSAPLFFKTCYPCCYPAAGEFAGLQPLCYRQKPSWTAVEFSPGNTKNNMGNILFPLNKVWREWKPLVQTDPTTRGSLVHLDPPNKKADVRVLQLQWIKQERFSVVWRLIDVYWLSFRSKVSLFSRHPHSASNAFSSWRSGLAWETSFTLGRGYRESHLTLHRSILAFREWKPIADGLASLSLHRHCCLSNSDGPGLCIPFEEVKNA